jgi:exonuclease SbcD
MIKILHTSDWHIGRTFHKYQTLDEAKQVLNSVVDIVKQQSVNVVVISGDIFDTSSPKEEAFEVLKNAFNEILSAGAQIVAISGNHDSAQRLGFAGAFSSQSGLHLITDVERVGVPVEITNGPVTVDFYGIPFIQPELWRHLSWMPHDASTQNVAIKAAMSQITESIEKRQSAYRKSVILSHTFIAGGEKETDESERAITKDPTVGGVDSVPAATFKGADYVALGHIHSQMISKEFTKARYSGALMYFSFKEVGKRRGGWIVEFSEAGEPKIDWVEFLVPRNIIELTGKFEDILINPKYDQYKDYYIQAVYTDDKRVIEPMRQLKEKFPFTANVIWLPENVAERSQDSHRKQLENKTDLQIIETFAKEVRNGEELSKDESAIVEPIMNEINSGGN